MKRSQHMKVKKSMSESTGYWRTVIQTLCVAVLADIKCINLIIQSYQGGEEEGSLPQLLLFLLLLLSLSALPNIKNIVKYIRPSLMAIIASCLMLYLLTMISNATPRTNFISFTVFCIFSLLVFPMSQINAKLLLKTMMLLPIVGILNVQKIFILSLYDIEKLSMGVSYAFLVPIISTIIYTFFYFRKEVFFQKLLTLCALAVNVIYLIYLLQYGSRGPILSIVLLVFFLYLFSFKNNEYAEINKKRVVPFFVLLVLSIVFMPAILELFQSILNGYGIDFRFVEKTLVLADENDISNGRSVVSSVALQGIIESPIWGHGFDLFDKNTHLLYPHNFLLQLLYDGGLILFIIVMFPTLNFFFEGVQKCRISEYIIMTTFLFSGVIGALFSGNMWAQSILWMFIGFLNSKPKIL